jgi:T-complex protein 1 subunit beta
VLVEISKTQDAEVGDGTTSVVVFCGELLRQAEMLINSKIHPMTVIQGYREVCNLTSSLIPLGPRPLLEGLGRRAAAGRWLRSRLFP